MPVSGPQEGVTAGPAEAALPVESRPLEPEHRRENAFSKGFLVSIAVANLCFINCWYDMRELDPPWVNYFRQHAQFTLMWATLADGLLLALVFWLGWQVAMRAGKTRLPKLGECAFLLILIFPLELVRQIWSSQNSTPGEISRAALIVTELSLAAGALQVWLQGKRKILKAARMAALAINLLFVAMLVNAIFAWLGSPTDAEFADQPAAPFQAAAAGQPPKPRVVWLLFDEMDQRLSFSERPASVHMPELDRILHESVSAADAQPTALWTSVAMPSLISGLRIAKVEPKGPSELRITDMDGKSLGSWQKLPNLFQDAGKMGFNSGLVGWHHPYCRVLGSATSYCRSETGFETRQTYVDELGMLRAMDFLFRQQLDYLLQSLHLISVKTTENEVQAFGRRHQLEQFFANRGRALELVKDPRFGLIFVHWPIPHPVGIYNRRKHDFSSQGEELTYLDNLELVDVTLGELRRAMESAGLWDDTTLLITADHGFRPDVWAERLKWMNDVQVDPRETEARPIPFLIRLPGGHPGSLYSKPFNSLVTHDLILALLAGRIRTPEDAQNWLDQNRFRFPLRENHPQRRPDKRE